MWVGENRRTVVPGQPGQKKLARLHLDGKKLGDGKYIK
jgi:hypothetical protein